MSNSSLRLESFLLPQDALATARTRLNSNGVVVLYNYYRQDWLIQKLANMVGNAFHQQPLVTTYGGWGRAAAIMAGAGPGSPPEGGGGASSPQTRAPRLLQLPFFFPGALPSSLATTTH